MKRGVAHHYLDLTRVLVHELFHQGVEVRAASATSSLSSANADKGKAIATAMAIKRRPTFPLADFILIPLFS